jgi:hypothetical protein
MVKRARAELGCAAGKGKGLQARRVVRLGGVCVYQRAVPAESQERLVRGMCAHLTSGTRGKGEKT